MPSETFDDRRFRYTPAGDLCVVTSYFSSGNTARRSALDRFRKTMADSSIDYRIVECAFGDRAFELETGPCIVHVRTSALLWQKERLLNHLISLLPPRFTKIAWVDGDILFEELDWAPRTSDMLDRWPIVQMFETVERLPGPSMETPPAPQRWPSWAAVHLRDPELAATGTFDKHGHTGFAWAARRSLLEFHPLYEYCLAGTGDHVMAHAMTGAASGPCIRRLIGAGTRHFKHFERWAQPLFEEVRGAVHAVPGNILHIWHGKPSPYLERTGELRQFDFDPDKHLRVAPNGCLEWIGHHPDLHYWASLSVSEGRPRSA
jgi:hypothetical protein